MGFVASADDEDPEIPVPQPEWGMEMARIRKPLMSQAELARRVGANQPDISNLESGVRKSSSLVIKICRELPGLSPPSISVRDPLEWRWLISGRLLREHAEVVFTALLSAAESSAKPYVTKKDSESGSRLPGGDGTE